MTCVAGLIHENIVYMGADSAGVYGYDLVVRADEKVFLTSCDNILMGIAGSFRMGQLLRYAFSAPYHLPQDKPDMQYLVVDFVDTMRNMFSEKGFLKKEDNEESMDGSSFLFAYKGNLYNVDCDMQVGKSAHNFDAVGCGAQIALGSLLTSQHIKDPVERLMLALGAAEAFSAGVRGPFLVMDSRGLSWSSVQSPPRPQQKNKKR